MVYAVMEVTIMIQNTLCQARRFERPRKNRHMSTYDWLNIRPTGSTPAGLVQKTMEAMANVCTESNTLGVTSVGQLLTIVNAMLTPMKMRSCAMDLGELGAETRYALCVIVIANPMTINTGKSLNTFSARRTRFRSSSFATRAATGSAAAAPCQGQESGQRPAPRSRAGPQWAARPLANRRRGPRLALAAVRSSTTRLTASSTPRAAGVQMITWALRRARGSRGASSVVQSEKPPCG
mmetsp:Transcript_38920/g.111034  ORF Transcript_38920/g.111034 Transcript_38920/m.111034 type:complete len:237 (+) Transcript_38920:962-1672(+)